MQRNLATRSGFLWDALDFMDPTVSAACNSGFMDTGPVHASCYALDWATRGHYYAVANLIHAAARPKRM